MSNLVHRVVRSADSKLLSSLYSDLNKSLNHMTNAISQLNRNPHDIDIDAEVRLANEYLMTAIFNMEEEVEEGVTNE